MAKYYRLHRGKIIGGAKGRKRSQPRDLKIGAIYEIRYDSETASKGRYLVLVLNLWPMVGGMKEQKAHCLDLAEVPPMELKKIIKESKGILNESDGKFEYQALKFPSGYSAPKVFYKKNIKKLEKNLPNIYKTFKLEKMKLVELLNYDFESALSGKEKKKQDENQLELFND
ncbi:hypothetical protein H8D04_01100 [bacterium]|nr:hypothetical protein [bacterium]